MLTESVGLNSATRGERASERASRLRVLLVYPEVPPTYWNMRYALPFIGKRASLPPLGIITVAAMLDEGCDVSLVDMNIEPLTTEHVRGADIVLTSSMLIQSRSHADVVRLCRALGKPVLAGGPYPTGGHADIAGVDYFVLGEAEGLLPRFLDDFRQGRAQRVYQGEALPDIAQSPTPRFDLLKRDAYASMALQFSRGCPYDCEFCDVVEMFGRKPRTKSPGQLLAEMEALHRTGYEGSVFIVDDNFIGNKRAVMQLLPQITRWQDQRGRPFRLYTETTVSLAKDDELMTAMVHAGFNSVFLGIETPVIESLVEAHKTQNLKLDLLESVRRINSKGLEVSAGFIVGFDGDPEDVFDRQLQFIREAGIPEAMVGLLTALPRTRLHKRLVAEGRLRGKTVGNNTHELSLNYVPKMEAGKLVSGYKRMLKELYEPENYFERCLQLLRTLKPHAASSRPVTGVEMRAFALSMLVQGGSSYGWAYWRFLAQALRMRPRMFPWAVTMAVKGHHFFTMTNEILPGAAETRRERLLEPARRAVGIGLAMVDTLRAALPRGAPAGAS
jgi:radical SAM superfamily enzyme YgiQ (UPF0313 family)